MIKQLARGLAVLMTIGAAAPAYAHDYKVGSLTLDHPVSRETPKGARVGAGYLTIENIGEADDRLLSVSCACAERSEIHEMKMDGGIMRMQALPGGLAIPAGGSAVLKPGGYHLMFIEIKQPFVAGEAFEATLTFEKAGSVTVEFTVEPLRKSKSGDHKGH